MTTAAREYTCRCRAYKFPHRVHSGECGKRPDLEERGGNRTERDNRADDPRHGQAADINRYR